MYGNPQDLIFYKLSYNNYVHIPTGIEEWKMARYKLHMPEDFEEAFSHAMDNSAQKTNWSHEDLVVLPKAVKNLVNTTNLNLSSNRLAELPPEIGKLSKLERLDLTKNCFERLPPEFKRLRNLGFLNLSLNRLTEIPSEVFDLDQLWFLDLSGNYIREVPEDILRMPNLVSLNLSSNRIRELPKEMRKMPLFHLDVSNNMLTSLPFDETLLNMHGKKNEDGSYSPTYEHLIFHGNPILPVPPEAFGMDTDKHFSISWTRYFKELKTL